MWLRCRLGEETRFKSMAEQQQPSLDESWVRRPCVLHLLAEILTDPDGDHSDGVRAALGDDPLRSAHVAGLVCA